MSMIDGIVGGTDKAPGWADMGTLPILSGFIWGRIDACGAMAATIAHAPLPHMASLAWQTLVERMGSLVETKKIQVKVPGLMIIDT